MKRERIREGQFDLVFTDRTTLSVSVYRDGGSHSFCWPVPGDRPAEHRISPGNQENMKGWLREVRRVFRKDLKTYDFTPAWARE